MMEGRIDWHFAELFIHSADQEIARHDDDRPSPVLTAVLLLWAGIGLCLLAAMA